MPTTKGLIFTTRETATILAALRIFQDAQDADNVGHLDQFAEVRPLTNEQINKLCERINFA